MGLITDGQTSAGVATIRVYTRVINNMSIEQFASKVVNFSSQYGTAGTSSYTASNLAHGLNIFPKYGDFTDAFVLVSLPLT